jgi:hypothetical protein
MRLFRYTRGEERTFLDSSFEPNGDGFGLILLGATVLWRGFGFEPPLRWLLLVAGVTGLVYGVMALAVRMLDLRSGRS